MSQLIYSFFFLFVCFLGVAWGAVLGALQTSANFRYFPSDNSAERIVFFFNCWRNSGRWSSLFTAADSGSCRCCLLAGLAHSCDGGLCPCSWLAALEAGSGVELWPVEGWEHVCSWKRIRDRAWKLCTVFVFLQLGISDHVRHFAVGQMCAFCSFYSCYSLITRYY